jgi:hypothetical protein
MSSALLAALPRAATTAPRSCCRLLLRWNSGSSAAAAADDAKAAFAARAKARPATLLAAEAVAKVEAATLDELLSKRTRELKAAGLTVRCTKRRLLCEVRPEHLRCGSPAPAAQVSQRKHLRRAADQHKRGVL